MRLSSISDVSVRFGPRTFLLLNMIDDWARRVVKFASDTADDPHPEGAIVWGFHDMVLAFEFREMIESSRPRENDVVADIAVLDAADLLLMKITEADGRALYERIYPNAVTPNWWWDRLPTTGPVRAEAEEILGNLT